MGLSSDSRVPRSLPEKVAVACVLFFFFFCYNLNASFIVDFGLVTFEHWNKYLERTTSFLVLHLASIPLIQI